MKSQLGCLISKAGIAKPSSTGWKGWIKFVERQFVFASFGCTRIMNTSAFVPFSCGPVLVLVPPRILYFHCRTQKPGCESTLSTLAFFLAKWCSNSRRTCPDQNLSVRFITHQWRCTEYKNNIFETFNSKYCDRKYRSGVGASQWMIVSGHKHVEGHAYIPRWL